MRLLLVERNLKETQNLALTAIQFLALCIRSANQPFCTLLSTGKCEESKGILKTRNMATKFTLILTFAAVF